MCVCVCTHTRVCVCACWLLRGIGAQKCEQRRFINPVISNRFLVLSAYSWLSCSLSPMTVMLRLAALGLFLFSAVTLSRSGIILENGLPFLWSQTASQVTELPMADGFLTPNPWHYLHRQSFYRLMIGATDPYMTYMGTTPTENPMWGLAIELGWMQTSGKMAFHCHTQL